MAYWLTFLGHPLYTLCMSYYNTR